MPNVIIPPLLDTTDHTCGFQEVLPSLSSSILTHDDIHSLCAHQFSAILFTLVVVSNYWGGRTFARIVFVRLGPDPGTFQGLTQGLTQGLSQGLSQGLRPSVLSDHAPRGSGHQNCGFQGVRLATVTPFVV